MTIIIILLVLAILLFFAAKQRAKKAKTKNWDGGPEFVLKDKGDDIIANAPVPHPVYGYSNFPKFVVSGKKAATGRKNTRHIYTKDEQSAREYAITTEGLVEPLEISPDSEIRPAGKSEYGLLFPKGATEDDQMQFETSVMTGDTKHIPPSFMAYLTARNIHMSWLSGRNHAADAAFKHVDTLERAALYGYAVYCSLHGVEPGNIGDSPMMSDFYAFANAAAKDISVYKSIANRPGNDMWTPAKNTKAYQFATAYFASK